MNFQSLETKIVYQFSNQAFLRQACTHCSYSPDNNERLEFFGDVLLSAVISEYLFSADAQYSEGELTQRRAALVCGPVLTEIARELDLGDYLLLGESERRSGQHRASILEDAIEALLAAVYLDGGWDPLRGLIHHLWGDRLTGSFEPPAKDAKTALQEWLQARRRGLPNYRVTQSGPSHEPTFVANCRVPGVTVTFEGEGATRRQAEQAAALKMHRHLEKQ